MALVYSTVKSHYFTDFSVFFYSHHEDATIDDDGLPTMTREKSKAQEEQKAVDKEEIENYKKHNPEFKKQMDEVHVCARAIYVHRRARARVCV